MSEDDISALLFWLAVFCAVSTVAVIWTYIVEHALPTLQRRRRIRPNRRVR